MRSMLDAGEYDVRVQGAQAGFLRVGTALIWFLGDAWRGARPSSFSVRRVGSLGEFGAWRQSVSQSSVPFCRGIVATRSGGVPSKVRGDGRGLLAMGRTPADGQTLLQLDPGVVGLWSGVNPHMSSDPDLGFGYGEGSAQVHTEVFVPIAGTARVDALSVRLLEEVPNANLVVRAFLRHTQGQNLDFGRGGEWDVSEYVNRQSFWQAARQNA